MVRRWINTDKEENKKVFFEILFFVALLLVYSIDLRTNFSRSGGTLIYYTLLYVGLSLTAAFIFTEGDSREKLKSFLETFIWPSIISILLPLLIGLFSTFIELDSFWMGINFLIIFFPAWILFFLFIKPQLVRSQLIKTLLFIYMTAWLIFGLVYGIANMPANINVGANTIDTTTQLRNTIDFVKDTFSGLSFTLKPPKIPSWSDFINKTMSQITGEQYKGKVENAQEQGLGVFIRNINQYTPTIYENQEIIVWGELYAKTLENENINITNKCHLIKQGYSVKDGMLNLPKVSVFRENLVNLICTIPNQTKGYYEVKFYSEFNFTTLAYIPYYFINEELLNNYRRDNKNINVEFGIPRNPVATYTPGPINIGINPGIQPKGIKEDNNIEDVFGVTITPNWYNGMLKNINELTFAIPEELSLIKCTNYDLPKPERNEEYKGYKLYKFKNIKVPEQGSYITILCNMKPVDHNNLRVGGITTRTIIVEADYEFGISQGKTIKVLESK